MPISGSSPNKLLTRTVDGYNGPDCIEQMDAAKFGIQSVDMDETMQDMADAINECLFKDGGNFASDVPTNGQKFTGVGNAAARNQFAAAGQVQDGSLAYAGNSSGTNTITATLSPAITAYAAGQVFVFRAGGTNTGAATINFNSVGAADIKKGKNGTTDLAAGDIVTGGLYAVAYNGTTSDFVLLNAPAGNRTTVAISSDTSFDAADSGRIVDADCTSDDIEVTLDDAAALGSDFYITIRHQGDANQILIIGDGTDTFGLPGASTTSFALVAKGQSVTISSDGTNLKTISESPPLIGGTNGVILCVDFLSTPPGSPQGGARYLVGSSPSGDWSGFSEHDIAEADGFGGWFNYTPVSGWLLCDQDSDRYYTFNGSAWVETPINMNGLTEDTNPDSVNDFIPIYDTSAGTGKKIKPYYTPGALIAVIEDRKSQSTDGGTFTTGADRVRTLTSFTFNLATLVSLSSNQFTLPAGIWEISWAAPGHRVNAHQSFLYDATNTTEIQRGTSEYSNNSDAVTSYSTGIARVNIASPTAYEIRHRCGTTFSTGFGRAADLGTEVYTRVIIRRA